MSKRLIPTLFLFGLFTSNTFAQNLIPQKAPFLKKADSYLKSLLREITPDDEQVTLILKADDESAKSKVKKIGGSIGTDLGLFFTATIPAKNIIELLKIEEISNVHKGPSYRSMNLGAKQKIGADKVHQGLGGLKSAYTGKGVVVGIIDSGIDFTHPDFRDPDDPSKSKIAYLWNQTDNSGSAPSNFAYGSLRTKADIEAELQKNEPEIEGEYWDPFFGVGHGTHVAGSAIGNRGIAPEATVIVVTVDAEDGGALVDAANFINNRAKELGMPCIINASWGTHLHPSDGFDFMSFFYDQLLAANPQLGICAAAGNSGPDGVFWGGNIVRDTVYTGKVVLETGRTHFYVENNNLGNLKLQIHVDSVTIDATDPAFGFTFQKNVGSTESTSFSDLLRADVTTDTFFHSSGEIAAIITIDSRDISADEPGYPNSEFVVTIDDRANWLDFDNEKDKIDFFRFEVTGSGRFYGKFDANPPNMTQPLRHGYSLKNYATTGNVFNIISPAVAFNVLAVGSYTNRGQITDVNGTIIPAPNVEGDLANTSSAGPTLNNRLKPEITAPGAMVLSSLSRNFSEGVGIIDQLYGTDPLGGNPAAPDLLKSGTSMAAPMVTGSIALMWQANPDLTFNEIKNLIIATASKDNFTEAVQATPNPGWGYGKLNALSAVIEAEKLYNPLTVNNLETTGIQISPNPASDELNINFLKSQVEIFSFSISDVSGKQLHYQHFEKPLSEIKFNMSGYIPGTYLVTVTTNKGKTGAKIFKR